MRDRSGQQGEAEAALADPALHDGRRPQRFDTHSAVVFVGPRRVFKLKRAVRYAFLDFSTPDLRRRYCREEVIRNRRTAPDLYLGMAALRRGPDGALRLGDVDAEPGEADGEGAADWVVVMRPFRQRDLFDAMARSGRLDAPLLRLLAIEAAEFHAAAEPRATPEGWAQGFADVVRENLKELAEQELFPAEALEAMGARCAALLESLAEALAAREAQGHVRLCHGDLHLRNICLVDERPVLFDCIEFNDRMAVIDTLYDLAFLLMDLDHREMRTAASQVMNRYLEATGDYGGVGLLPLYLAARAQIRAKVGAMAASVQDGREAEATRAEARAYFDLAARYLEPAASPVVAVGGPSGSGKSTVARALAPRLAAGVGAVILRSDAIRKELMAVPEYDALPKAAYTTEVSMRVYAVMEDRAIAVAQQGMPAIADATFTHPDSRARIENRVSEAGLPFRGVWLDVPPEVLIARVRGRGADASDADEKIVGRQLRDDWGQIGWARVPARDLDETVAGILTLLPERAGR